MAKPINFALKGEGVLEVSTKGEKEYIKALGSGDDAILVVVRASAITGVPIMRSERPELGYCPAFFVVGGFEVKRIGKSRKYKVVIDGVVSTSILRKKDLDAIAAGPETCTLYQLGTRRDWYLSDDKGADPEGNQIGISVAPSTRDEADWGKIVGVEKAGVKAGALSQGFYTNMDWWDVAEQPSSFDSLPPEFLEAKSLWSKGKKGSQEKIIELLSPFVGACIIPGNISGWDELFVQDRDIGAAKINVVGIDFCNGPIPRCKAEAFFEVEVVPNFPSIDLEEWQDDNDRFWVAVSFYWNIPKNDETKNLDFSYGDNKGTECVPMDWQSGSTPFPRTV